MYAFLHRIYWTQQVKRNIGEYKFVCVCLSVSVCVSVCVSVSVCVMYVMYDTEWNMEY